MEAQEKVEEETITFETIRKVQRAEQKNAKLTKLPENFFERVADYLATKRKISNKKEDRKTILEIRNTERLVEDIFNRRERKVINQALITVRTGIPPENLTPEEKGFFDKLVGLLKERRERLLHAIIKPSHTSKKEKVQLLVFKEDVPEFLGVDMRKYGPFKKGDIAKIPKENANILVASGKAEIMEVEV